MTVDKDDMAMQPKQIQEVDVTIDEAPRLHSRPNLMTEIEGNP